LRGKGKVLVPLFIVAGVVVAQLFAGTSRIPTSAVPPLAYDSDAEIARAFQSHVSGVQVQDQGTVVKVLADDEEGSRHQRFIVRLRSGQTILIAHNIDLAQRVSPLNEGDSVSFRGEFAWDAKGGVVHWTHQDPRGGHPPGWVMRGGKFFR
jgi:hypothetical protein